MVLPPANGLLPPTAGTPRIEPARRLRALLEVLICSGIPTQIAIGRALISLGWTPGAADRPALGFIAPLLLLDTAVLIALMVFFVRSEGESVRQLWLGTRPWPREATRGLVLVPLIFLLVVVLLNTLRLVAPWLHTVPDNPFEHIATQGAGQAILFALVTIVGGGVREELQRAFMLRRFERYLGGTTVGVVVLSVAFGAGHYNQGLDAIVTTAVLGALWALMYVRRRSSVAAIVSHAGFNSLEVLRVALMPRG